MEDQTKVTMTLWTWRKLFFSFWITAGSWTQVHICPLLQWTGGKDSLSCELPGKPLNVNSWQPTGMRLNPGQKQNPGTPVGRTEVGLWHKLLKKVGFSLSYLSYLSRQFLFHWIIKLPSHSNNYVHNSCNTSFSATHLFLSSLPTITFKRHDDTTVLSILLFSSNDFAPPCFRRRAQDK